MLQTFENNQNLESFKLSLHKNYVTTVPECTIFLIFSVDSKA